VTRKALSKKLRFEVFKRDNFTCQYCGRAAPDEDEAE
jgi:5-methylcytosine-specific restriction endonuclease McrA